MVEALSIGSLFSGVGGLDLAVEAVTGGRVAWMCERDAYCRRVLARHWPGVPIFEDIETLTDPPRVDVLAGGFPCQDISLANSQRKGLEGEKSGLWFQFARLIRDIRPRLVFLENVAAIRTAGMDAVLGSLAALRYDAEWACFRASDVGAPHRRDRWFCVGWLADTNRARPQISGVPGELEQALAGSCGSSFRSLFSHQWPPTTFDVDGWRSWIGSGLCSPMFRRSPDGTADELDISDVRNRLRSLGNAVCPQQAAEAYRRLMRRGKLL